MDKNIPYLKDTGKGLTLKLGGRYLASPYAPKEKAEKIAHNFKINERCIYIIPSPLFAYGLNILAQKLPSNSRILCIEQNQSVMKISTEHFPLPLLNHHQIDYIRSENIEQILGFLKDKGFGLYRKCELLLLNGLNPDNLFYQTLIQEIRRELNSYWKNRITMIELGNRWISNIFQNLSFAKKAKPFPETNKPLVICGAGASLSSCMDLILEQRDLYFLLAVDTALPALRDKGIQPDAVVNLDGQFYNALDFYHSSSKIIRLCDMTAYPSTLREGPISLFLSRFCESDFLEVLDRILGITTIAPLGSVGVTAYELSCRITEGPIILCGLDFAYIPGASHVKGSIFQQHYLNSHNRLFCDAGFVERVFKKKTIKLPQKYLYSDSLLQSYHENLVNYIKRSGRRVYKWKQMGLPIDLEEWDPENNFENRDDSSGKRTGQMPIGILKHPEQIEVLIKKWKELLYNILNLWNAYQQSSDCLDDLLNLLQAADFLYLGSPFTPPEPREEPQVLTLLIVRCRKILELLEHLQAD